MNKKSHNENIEFAILLLIFVALGIISIIHSFVSWFYESALALKITHPYWFYAALVISVILVLDGIYYGLKKGYQRFTLKRETTPTLFVPNASEQTCHAPEIAAGGSYKLSGYDLQIEALGLVSSLKPRPILNKEELNSFYAAKNVVKDLKNYHVHAQVSMGEFIKINDPDQERWKNAKAAINAKRVDILICDNCGNPALVIEYQGSGHNIGKDSEERNDVKKLALLLGGIELLETFETESIPEIERKIRQELIKTATSQRIFETLCNHL